MQHSSEFFNFLRFEVPKNSGDGFCGASLIRLYFDTLNEDLKTNITNGPVFYKGTMGPQSNVKISKFTKEVIGKVTLSNTGKEVARFFNLPNPDKYTGLCFR